MNKVKLTIDGRAVEACEGATIMEAAALAGIEIPALCFLKDCGAVGACRICVVEVEGMGAPVAACTHPAAQGMAVRTHSDRLEESRKRTLDFICRNHRMDCDFCSRYTDCELHALMRRYGIDEREYSKHHRPDETDDSAVGIEFDRSKCVDCRRCVGACRRQDMNVLQVIGRGADARIGPWLPLGETECVRCGQCLAVCPTGALGEKEELGAALHMLEDPGKFPVAVVAPEVCAQIGEEFAEEMGTDVSGKLAAMLRRMGFARVLRDDGGKLLAARALAGEIRAAANGERPLLTSDCPAWVSYCKTKHPALSRHISEAADPRTLMSEACREVFAQEAGDREVVVVSLTPCTAGRYESQQSGRGADLTMSTRELAACIKRSCVSRYTAMHVWRRLPDEPFDRLAGDRDGGERLTSRDGGVLSAALAIAGAARLDDGRYELDGRTLRVASVTGLGAAAELLAGGADWDVVGVMACPGGCINGGGQPRVACHTRNFGDVEGLRLGALERQTDPMRPEAVSVSQAAT